jgi:glutathione synthase/RimK-type ligase-like ATP-grasp enzyme
MDYMREICQRASEVLDVKIYGGDCIVSPNGEIRIIDFNDWPSFAPCRNEAAPFIAKSILNTIKERQ